MADLLLAEWFELAEPAARARRLGGPCPCWYGPVALHDLHCCFAYYDAERNVVTCGHDTEGMQIQAGLAVVGVRV